MKRIYFHNTRTYYWHGNPVGIVRTEIEIFNQLSKYYDLIECIWNGDELIVINRNRINTDTQETKIIDFKLHKKKKQTINIINKIRSNILFQKLLKYNKKRNLISLVTQNILKIFKKFFPQKIVDRHKINCIKNSLNNINKNYIYCRKDDLQRGDIFVTFGIDNGFGELPKCLFELKRRGVKIISCVYDCIPITNPQFMGYNLAQSYLTYFLDLAEYSDVVFCISDSTKKEFLNLLSSVGANIPRIEMIRLGDSELKYDEEEITSDIDSILNDQYILFVSTFERRKNHQILYSAYHIIKEKEPNIKLPKMVLVGRLGWGYQHTIKDIKNDPRTKDLFVMLHNLNDYTLRKLYENALFCVYPSFFEGWGLPISEAMSFGKLVVCSNTSSMPEVGKNLVKYCSPWNAEEWATTILDLIKDNLKLIKLSENVKKNYKKYTWEDSCKQILDTIKSISKY